MGQRTRATCRRLHARDRKSTRLNSSHITISYAVFCLKKKKNNPERPRGQRKLQQNMSPKFIRFAIEQSLQRLGVDHVAIYQPHIPRVVTLIENEHWETLEAFKSEGNII